MAIVRMFDESREYLRVRVSADVTLDTQPVAIAITPTTGRPTDWIDAIWEGDADSTRVARLDPDWRDNVDAGRYLVWVKLTDSPEVPVVRAGQLVIV